MDYSFLLGKNIMEVRGYLSDAGVPFRISSEEGMPMMLTCDYNQNRVNLEVQNGIVKKISVG